MRTIISNIFAALSVLPLAIGIGLLAIAFDVLTEEQKEKVIEKVLGS